MWFAIGLIIVVLAFGFALHKLQQPGWRGTTHWFAEPRRKHVPYDFEVDEGVVRMGVAGPGGLRFRFREEGERDVFFKRLGVSEELQTLDPTFDQRLYLEADAIALRDVLRQNAQLRAAILRMFDAARAFELEGCRLNCLGSRLWVEFSATNHWRRSEREVIRELLAVASLLQQSELAAEPPRDPFFWKAAALLAASTAVAILGGWGLTRSLFGRTDIIEPWRLLLQCIPVGLVLTALFLSLVLLVLGRSSRAHVVLIQAAIVGTFGFITGSFALAREANIEFDVGGTDRHELQEVRTERHVSSGRRSRGRRHYYLHAPDWRPDHPGEQLKLEIDGATYSRLQGLDAAVIITKQGALGHEWIQDITALPAPLGRPVP